MSLKIGELKQNEIRTKISVLINNQEEIVTVKNAIGKKREQLLFTWDEKSKNNSATAPLEFTKVLLTELTDLEVGGLDELNEVVSNPRAELSLILHEVNEIMQEIIVEYWTGQIRQLNQSNINMLVTQALQKTETLNDLTKGAENAKTPVSILKKDLDRDIQKMSSPKKRK